MTAPPSTTLGGRLRSATRPLHAEVEAAPLIRALARGTLERAAYCALLRNLHAIYDALEQALRTHASDARLGAFPLDELARSAALARDLAALHGSGWDTIEVRPAARAYVERLRALAAERPQLLAAHVYVRYLGDLYGGQLLARAIAPQHPAVAFYDFGGPAEVKRLIAAVRAGLSSFDGDAALTEAIVQEAVSSFERHRALFGELPLQ